MILNSSEITCNTKKFNVIAFLGAKQTEAMPFYHRLKNSLGGRLFRIKRYPKLIW